MSTAKPAKRRQAGDGKAAEQKKQLAKAKKAVKEREETTLRTLMSIIQEPSAVHRYMPLERLRGPLQAIVNDPVKFGLLLPDGDRDESGLDAKLTTAFVKAVHGLSSDLPPPEATLQIVGAEHRKKLDSSFAAGGKHQVNRALWTRGPLLAKRTSGMLATSSASAGTSASRTPPAKTPVCTRSPCWSMM
jgi:hypothetical protein